MKPVKTLAIGTLVVLMLTTVAFINKSTASRKPVNYNTATNGFAVLELFTSEGCSSCPAADDLLARVQKEAGNQPIYVLAYHVDYWNRLGWKDAFSDAKYSKRQYQYSRQFAGQVYTPQVIINGKSECIGSDAPALSSSISQGFNTPSAESLSIQGQQQATKIALNYQLTGKANNSQLVIAVVQKHAISQVKKGENEGRTLAHAQIVRNLYTIDLPAGKQGTAHIDLPNDFNANEWEIIGMVQNAITGEITAATRVKLMSPSLF